MSLTPLLRAVAFYAALVFFGVWGVVFNCLSFLCGWLPAAGRTERVFQRLIQRQLALFLRGLALLRLVQVEYRGWERTGRGPAVIVANHPGLLDALYLLARVPRAFCVFKRAIRRNPVLGASARRAGYLPNDGGVDLVRGATERIARGASLVIFPEGTRTPPHGRVESLRAGFAGIARRAGVPVQLVRITVDRPLLAKGAACWRLPALPVHVVVEAGPALDAAEARSTRALVAEVEAWFRGEAACAGLTTTDRERTLTVA